VETAAEGNSLEEMFQAVAALFFCLLMPVSSDHHVRAVVKIRAENLWAELNILVSDGSANVVFQLKTLNTSVGNVTLAIHELPPSYRSSCNPDDVGDIFDPENAQMAANYNDQCANNNTSCAIGDLESRIGPVGDKSARSTTFPNNELYLSGHNSIIGRSLVVYNATSKSPLGCGVIRRPAATNMKEIDAVAKLYFPIGGTVSFRQLVDTKYPSNRSDTEILVNVFTNDGSAGGNYTWYLTSGRVSKYDCSSFASTSQPTRSASCNKNAMDNCNETDLSGKHGQLAAQKGKGQRSFYTDSNLNVDALTSMVLVLRNSTGQVVSCGNVDRRLGITAKFNGAITGYINCLPTDGGATVHVKLDGLNGQATDYDIHPYPVDGNSCDGAGDHFDPFGSDNDDDDTHDDDGHDHDHDDHSEQAVGDITAIPGSLRDETSVDFQAFDSLLRCDGWYGILGRSIGIHWKNGSLWQCATFEPLVPLGLSAEKSTVVATFMGDYSGTIKLTQWKLNNGQLSDTVVDVFVRKTGILTKDHDWHIHQKKTAGFAGNGPTNCHANYTGGHYNPHNVYLTGTYATDCNKQNQLRCELGDLSKKHGRYSIQPVTSTMGRRLSTDVDLPLYGPNSVGLRSIVIHDPNAGAARLVCATLYPDGYRPYSVTFKKPDSVDTSDIQTAIASGLGITAGSVSYLNVYSQGNCTSATFAVPDATAAQLKSDFESSLTFGQYQVDNNCLRPSPSGTTPPSSDAVGLCVLLLLYLL
jgi:Cu/Zn superoxide dismutase